MGLVVPWEVFPNESYEKLPDVSLDVLVLWGLDHKVWLFLRNGFYCGVGENCLHIGAGRRTRYLSRRSRRCFWSFQIPLDCKTGR